MACSLKAELKCKDGTTNKFSVEVGNNLKSLIEGVKKINAEISVVLTELVEEERSLNTESGERRAHAEDEEEEDEEDDGEERAEAVENTTVNLKSEPPAKRRKALTSP